MPMSDLVYRAGLGRTLGRSEELFRQAMKLADVTPVFELCRPDDFNQLDQVIQWITGVLEETSWTQHALAG